MYGDPKRPKNINHYVHRKLEEPTGSDLYQLTSMIFGVVSFLFKVRIHCVNQ